MAWRARRRYAIGHEANAGEAKDRHRQYGGSGTAADEFPMLTALVRLRRSAMHQRRASRAAQKVRYQHGTHTKE